ncbi:MAG: RAD55 family ATPase, partial [Candidatus Lokiarchaeia archaeon]
MRKYDTISTGIPKLDEYLGGGIFTNSMVLISYQTGFRYTEFISWMMPVMTGREFFVILVDYIRPVEELLKMAGILEFKEEEVKNDKVYVSFDRMRIINCFSSDVNKKLDLGDKVLTLDDPFDVDKLFSMMRSVREKLPKDAWVIWVFWSLTDLSIGLSEEEIPRFFRRVSRLHKSYDDLAFYLLNMDAHNPKFLALIAQLVDVIINFKIEETEEKLRNYIQVVKSPLPVDTTKLYYDIDPNGKR